LLGLNVRHGRRRLAASTAFWEKSWRKAMQLWRHAGARNQGGDAGQVMRFGQQGLQTRIRRDQWLKRVGFAAHACIFAKFMSL